MPPDSIIDSMIPEGVIRLMTERQTHDRIKEVLDWIVEAKRLGARLTPGAALLALDLFTEVYGKKRSV